jgi:hypothetical protein
MEKTIVIEDKEVRFKATASTTRRYRERFNRDLFIDINKLLPQAQKGEMTAGDLEVFENIAYIMAKQADPSIPDDPDDWLDEFEFLSIYEVLPQIIQLWGLNVETLNEPRKK